MVLYHFSPVDTQFLNINPAKMGSSVNAGREIQNQFTNGTIGKDYLFKANYFTKDSEALELHRFGYMTCYGAIINDSELYNIDNNGYKTDIEIWNLGFKGYYTQGQVRMYRIVSAVKLGKIQLPQGITFKVVGNAIKGDNLEDYLV